MRRTDKPKPLYRKENTTAHGAHHVYGGDYEADRHKKSDAKHAPMHGRKHGLDYTPLFRFLLSHVGSKWDNVYSEARSRLDKPDPIFWLVALEEDERRAQVRVGESSYYSGLFVDDEGFLRVVDPTRSINTLVPSCRCCTYTFNGAPLALSEEAKSRRYSKAMSPTTSTDT